jgi:predicted  nucleic acid-binding Zn-ribbon protein
MDCRDCPYKDQANALQKQIEELNSTNMDLIKQRNDQSMHRGYHQKKLDEKRKEVNDYINQEVEMKNKIIAMKRQIATQNLEIETLKSQSEKKKTTVDKSVITDSAEDYVSEIANLKKNISELEKTLKAAQSGEDIALGKVKETNNKIEQMKKTISLKSTEIIDLKKKLAQKSADSVLGTTSTTSSQNHIQELPNIEPNIEAEILNEFHENHSISWEGDIENTRDKTYEGIKIAICASFSIIENIKRKKYLRMYCYIPPKYEETLKDKLEPLLCSIKSPNPFKWHTTRIMVCYFVNMKSRKNSFTDQQIFFVIKNKQLTGYIPNDNREFCQTVETIKQENSSHFNWSTGTSLNKRRHQTYSEYKSKRPRRTSLH